MTAIATPKTKLRPLMKIHGGKYYLAPKMAPMFPVHPAGRGSPFGGMWSEFLNLPAHPAYEAYNELDARRFNVMYMCQNRPEWMIRELSQIEYNKASFDWAVELEKRWDSEQVPWSELDAGNRLDHAVYTYTRNRMSRGGLGKAFAWSDRLRGGKPGDVNAWETSHQNLTRVSDRIQHVDLLHDEALIMVREWRNRPGFLIYLDPPYVHKTRTAKKAYGKTELSDDGHENLLCLVTSPECVAEVVISGYPSDLYAKYLQDWITIDFDLANNSGQNKVKQRRTERLYVRPTPAALALHAHRLSSGAVAA